MQSVIADAHYGTASPAYGTFFKSSIYDIFVSEILTNITTGAAIAKLKTSRVPVPASPVLTCITGPNQVIDNVTGDTSNPLDLWDGCAGGKGWAFYLSGTNSIFLCPRFFTVFQDSPTLPGMGPEILCPTVSGGQFEGFGGFLAETQVYIVLHELLHFYLGNSPPPATNSYTEVNEINAAFNLSAVEAISNAQSYVFYAASECEREGSFLSRLSLLRRC